MSSAPIPDAAGLRRPTVGRARVAGVPILVLLVWLCLVRPLAGQADRVAAGVAGVAAGAVTGVWTTTAIYVAKARFGSFIFSPADLVRLRWETLPIATFPITGGALGAASPSSLGQAVVWGGLGFLAGAGLGALTGQLVRGTSEARWAGAIIGSGVGVLAGVVFGALRSSEDDEPVPAIGISIPLGGSGGGT